MDANSLAHQIAGDSILTDRCGPTVPERLARFFLALVDSGLLATIFIAPLFMGGRHEVGQLAYVAIVCATMVCWAMRQCLVTEARWRWSGAELLLLGGTVLVLLQLAPLPPTWLARISPEVRELLPLWTSPDGWETRLGIWRTSTLTPQATRAGLATLLAHGMLFLVVVQRIGDRADLERLVRWIGVAAIAMAVLGLAQFLCGNGKFLWIYEHPSRSTGDAVKGTFQNQNHFAHFLALGIGPLIWWLQRLNATAGRASRGFSADIGGRVATARGAPQAGRGSRSRGETPGRGAIPGNGLWLRGDRMRQWDRQDITRLALTIGLGLIALAGLLTFSRGGMIAISVTAAVCLGILYRGGMLGRRAAMAIIGAAVLLAGAVAVHGYEPLARRLATFGNARSLSEFTNGRTALWNAHVQAIPKFSLVGAGVGTHPEIYPTYMREHVDLEFTHGESGYLHLLLETGFFGLALGLLAAALASYWCLGALGSSRTPSDTALAAALLAGLSASLIHSLVDFVWYIPACMSLTILTAACACRLFQMACFSRRAACSDASGMRASRFALLLEQADQLRWGRAAWPVLTLALAVVASALIASRIPPARAALAWDAYRKLALAERRAPEANRANALDAETRMIAHLADALDRDPYHARANLRMAKLQIRRFDARQQAGGTPMPLAQIRDAALASQFPTPAAQDRWLSRVMGDNRRYLDSALRHARRALRLCPLQGEGYVHLAELAFLEGQTTAVKQAYVEQAVRVRPYSGVVLLAAGAESALAGDEPRALALYKRAFHQAPEQQTQVIQWIAPHVSAGEFLEQFAPSGEALDELFTFYRKRDRADDARVVGRQLVRSLERTATRETGPAAGRRWERAGEVHEFLGNPREAADCARNAVFHTPHDYRRRQRLAGLLQASGELEAAIAELQWCLNRKPNDACLRRDLELASRQRLAQRNTDGLY